MIDRSGRFWPEWRRGSGERLLTFLFLTASCRQGNTEADGTEVDGTEVDGTEVDGTEVGDREGHVETIGRISGKIARDLSVGLVVLLTALFFHDSLLFYRPKRFRPVARVRLSLVARFGTFQLHGSALPGSTLQDPVSIGLGEEINQWGFMLSVRTDMTLR